MQKFFEYTQSIIEDVFYNYFQIEKTSNKKEEKCKERGSQFQQGIKEYIGIKNITDSEFVILGIALAPHFSPQTLDLFFVENEVLNRPFTEFGGKFGNGHNAFIPTGETAMFVLTEGNAERRIEMMTYFNPQHWLYVSGVLGLKRSHFDEPLLSGVLTVSETFLNYLYSFSNESESKTREKHISENRFLDKTRAKTSPCLQCKTAPCCKLLHLEDFTITTYTDFDKIAYYLNFENIEVVLSPQGNCTVYYSTPCRFFKEDEGICTIHNKKEQPSICIHYSPYNCFYKRAEIDKSNIEYGNIWLNNERLGKIQEMVLFDDNRMIAQVPPFSEIVDIINMIPYVNENHANENQDSETLGEYILEPCLNCSALCCTHLLFPSNIPMNKGNWDYYKYTMGFPGIEHIVTDSKWATLVHTRCRNLNKKNRCSIYNKDERPLYCRYFDPYKCHVKQVLKTPYKVKINYNNFSIIEDKMHFDQLDNLKEIERVESLKISLNQ